MFPYLRKDYVIKANFTMTGGKEGNQRKESSIHLIWSITKAHGDKDVTKDAYELRAEEVSSVGKSQK